ncbi:MAG: YHS domain-containing protein [Rhodobacteraceae bacterium]|nr:YHS domain-containing protein [Paracoccaceae bacterium]
MSWLSQNWLWIALAVGVIFFMTRRGGFGMGRSMRYNQGPGQDAPASRSLLGGVDPVSKHSVAPGTSSISSVYRDRAYYFETRENRDAFEAEPEKYLTGTAAAGQLISGDRQGHRRHGC